MKLGDLVSSVATPIARAFDMPCIDPLTNQLRPESGCAKRRDALNRFSDTLSDFWTADRQRKERGVRHMTFIVTKQIQVEAETPEEAVANSSKGTVISLACNARPMQGIPPGPPRPGSPGAVGSTPM